jgi:hypothetical protein
MILHGRGTYMNGFNYEIEWSEILSVKSHSEDSNLVWVVTKHDMYEVKKTEYEAVLDWHYTMLQFE